MYSMIAEVALSDGEFVRCMKDIHIVKYEATSPALIAKLKVSTLVIYPLNSNTPSAYHPSNGCSRL